MEEKRKTKRDHRDTRPGAGKGAQGLSRRHAQEKREQSKDNKKTVVVRDALEQPSKDPKKVNKSFADKNTSAQRKREPQGIRLAAPLSTKKLPEREAQEIRKPKIKVIYEDDDMVIVDKPANMLTIPSPAGEAVTLTSLVDTYLKLKDPTGPSAHPCHRLDRDTTGLIIFAKGKANQKKIMDQFHEHKVSKKYLALVNGVPKEKSGKIEVPLEDKPAVTKYTVIEAYNGFSLVQFEPLTGRTNQIRIHAKSINHHLLGERKYAYGKDSRFKFNRVALHASALGFKHPLTGNLMSFSSPLPQDMERFVEKNHNAPIVKVDKKSDTAIVEKKLERKIEKKNFKKAVAKAKESETESRAQAKKEKQKKIQKKFYEKLKEGSRERNKRKER